MTGHLLFSAGQALFELDLGQFRDDYLIENGGLRLINVPLDCVRGGSFNSGQYLV